jgi:predicted nucleic acid-binding protein
LSSYKRVIKISEKAKNSILQALAFYADEVPIYYKIRPNLKDENDDLVFECAANYNADFLVTHNVRDFLNADLAPYRFRIITPQKFPYEVLYG